jgi:integration host factor subunit beta
MAINKSVLATVVADKLNIPTKRANAAVDEVFAAMTAALARGERIEIRGFGSWVARRYGARSGRNPKSGEPIAVAATRRPYFKAGKELSDRIMAAWRREQSQPDP